MKGVLPDRAGCEACHAICVTSDVRKPSVATGPPGHLPPPPPFPGSSASRQACFPADALAAEAYLMCPSTFPPPSAPCCCSNEEFWCRHCHNEAKYQQEKVRSGGPACNEDQRERMPVCAHV